MHQPRKMCSGVFMDGKFYVIGGLDDHSKPLTNGEEFDMETRTWKEIPSISPRGSEMPPLVAVVNNERYAADSADNMDVSKYDNEAGTWSTVGRLPERAADSDNGWRLAFVGCGDRLIFVGGPKCYGSIEVNSWASTDDEPAQWELLATRSTTGGSVLAVVVAT